MHSPQEHLSAAVIRAERARQRTALALIATLAAGLLAVVWAGR